MIIRLLAVLLALPSFASANAFRVASLEGGRLTINGRAAEAGAALEDGADLRLDGGKAVLDFGGEGKLLLTGPARFRLKPRGVELKSGGLLSVLNKLVGGFEVSTPAAVAAVRGTEFYIEPRGERSTYVCLCGGKVDVTAPGGSGKPITIKSAHHKPFLFTRTTKGLVKKGAKMENHTDAEIASLLK